MADEAVVDAVMVELRRAFPNAPAPVATVIARLGNDTFQRVVEERADSCLAEQSARDPRRVVPRRLLGPDAGA